MAAAIKRLVTKVTAAKETAPSPLKRHYLRLAVYNVWANEVLWEKASVIPLTEYVADKKLFFKSIHGTMNHIYLADKLWYSRIMGSPIMVTGLNQEFFGPNQHGALRDAIATQGEMWFDYICALKDEEFDQTFSYMDRYDKPQVKHRGFILDHIFNHATHHRGQISAALTMAGLPPPEMDLLFVPEDIRIY